MEKSSLLRHIMVAVAFVLCSSSVWADDYATPVCPSYGRGCFEHSPEQPNSAAPTYADFLLFSGLDYFGSKVSNISVEVDGSVVRASGTVTPCTDCPGFLPPPARDIQFVVPPLAAGTYSVELRLTYDPSYTDHPSIDTESGWVHASELVISAQMTVVQGTTNEQEAVVEYYDPATAHYFMTPLAGEIALLDAHQPPFVDWRRTGSAFNAYVSATAPTDTSRVCRFFNDSFGNGQGTHFYAAMGLGCEVMYSGQFPDWQAESNELFNTAIPSADGNCLANTIPVYRLYNNGEAGVPNHRFVTDANERQKMIDRGWIPEGFGIGVAMCAPAA
jgi:hypothetical protein